MASQDEECDIMTVDECIPFHDFADFLESLSNTSNSRSKEEKATRFLNTFRQKFLELHGTMESNAETNNDSIFSIIRLLYPLGDKTRAAYNFKSPALSRIFAKILAIDKTSEDGKKLFEYQTSIKNGAGASDLSLTVYTILCNRFSRNPSRDSPTVAELHKVLDQLARDHKAGGETITQDQQITILRGFIRKLTPKEGKWLVRILLKNLFLGLNKNQIFRLIHPKAAGLLDTLDLETVCKMLNNSSTSLVSTDGSNIVLFTFFKPMLCARLNKIDGDEDETNADEEDSTKLSQSPKKLSSQKAQEVKLPAPPFVLETKFDGERCQIHYQYNDDSTLPDEDRHKFKYFSRNGFDYTTSFQLTLSPRLTEQLVKDQPVRNFILDGEMMAWNKSTKSFTQKSGNIDVKTLGLNDLHCPLFMVFDIVYFNGLVLANKPLIERREYLSKALVPEESTIQFSEQTPVEDKALVTDALNNAIDNLEEGLVVKTLDSTYEPGKRALNWLKIKPEYIEGHAVEDLDLLILGAFYSDSVRSTRGHITNFLVGVISDNYKEFYSIAKVGMGMLNYQQRGELITSLADIFVDSDFSSVKYGRNKRPDKYIDPKKSIILQVKASEITSTKEYDSKYTLRFPRVVKVRLDKPWEDAMTLKELYQLRDSCEGKLAKKSNSHRSGGNWFNKNKAQANSQDNDLGSSSDDDDVKPKKPNKAGLKLAPLKKSPKKCFMPSGNSNLMATTSIKKSSIFEGHVFCVLGDDKWKKEIISLLKSHGAAKEVANPTPDSFCIVADKESLRIKNYKKHGKHDIAKGRIWIDKCIAANKIVNFLPEDLFFAKETTRNTFSKEYDEYGDSFTKPSTVDEVKMMTKAIIEQENNNPPENNEDMKAMRRAMDEELFPTDDQQSSSSSSSPPKLPKWSFLSECKILFLGNIPNQISLEYEIEFYRGTITKSKEQTGITHVIVEEKETADLSHSIKTVRGNNKSALFVNSYWLLNSLTKREVIPELAYKIKFTK